MTSTTAQRAIRDIAAIVDLNPDRPTAAYAADIARRVDAHLLGLSLVYDPLIPVYTVATPLPAEFIADAREQAVGEAKSASDNFAAAATTAGINAEMRTIESVGTSGLADVVRQCALADLVIVGQQSPKNGEPVRDSVIEGVLFHAGVPTLIVPHSGRTSFNGGPALVAWNGSPTSARAAREALPVLALASSVTVAIVEDGKVQGGSGGNELATFLARHGLEVTVRSVPLVHRDIAGTLLGLAKEEGSELMVMGAYGHGRLREFILGGATRGILDEMTLPILMAH